MGRRTVSARTVLAFTCVLAACTAGDAPDKNDGRVSANAVSVANQSLAITLRLPSSTKITEPTLAGSEGIEVEERANVDGSIASVGGNVAIEKHADVGAITAIGDVSLGNHARVRGDVQATGSVQRDRHAGVDGTIRPVTLTPVDVTWTVQAPEQSAGPVELVSGQFRDLAPGTYDDLVLPPKAKVVLHSGVYVVDKAVVHRGAEILVDDTEGPAQLYVKSEVFFRGTVSTATAGTPALLVGYLGTSKVTLRPPFVGVFLAPSAEVALEPCKSHGGDDRDPHRDDDDRGHGRYNGEDGRRDHDDDDELDKGSDGHGVCDRNAEYLGVFYGSRVRAGKGTHVSHLGFDWATTAGPQVAPSIEGQVRTVLMPSSPVDLSVNVDAEGTGGASGSADTGRVVTFSLRDEYEVASGIIGNGTVQFRFRETAGQLVTCTYQGRSPTATPQTPTDLNLGRLLRFVGCTDGRPFHDLRRGTHFELIVAGAPAGAPVSVRPPIIRDGGCSEDLPLLTPDETRRMREGFDWRKASKVGTQNPDGTPALYYAWIFIRTPAEALALRKLYIHVLKRPLFTEELARFAGRCGTITNPGDGEGTFVPVLIPGVTYNALVDAITSSSIKGDRTIFDVVLIRGLAPEHRFPNGALRTDLLFSTGFRYLDYETKPLRPADQIQLDSGASKVLTDALTFVANAGRSISEALSNVLGSIAAGFSGRVGMTLHLHAINQAPTFMSAAEPNPIMLHGWGPWAGQPLGALGMQVTILQRVPVFPFPFTSQGKTDRTGKVFIDAIRDARPFQSPLSASQSGLCVDASTKAGFVTDFLISTEICDFRRFERGKEPTDFAFNDFDFGKSQELDLHINNTRLTALYQADDVWLWSNDMANYRPRRARMLSGYFATTFSATNPNGKRRAFAPCFGYTRYSDAIAAAAAAPGAALALAGFLPGGQLAALAGITFGAVVGSSDIVISTDTDLPTRRELMSHEYGHFLFCSLLNDHKLKVTDDPVGRLVLGIVGNGANDLRVPERYIHEGFADFVAGQVTGAANYPWTTPSLGFTPDGVCLPPGPAGSASTCFDSNLRGSAANSKDATSIGRIVTLLHDVYDGHTPEQRFKLVPGDGDVWTGADPANKNLPPAILSLTGYANADGLLERVALDGESLPSFGKRLDESIDGPGFTDGSFYKALDRVMSDRGLSWCDRCRVFALHSTSAPATPNIAQLFGACRSDALLASTLGPAPDPDLRLDANTCTSCPPSFTSDDNGVCVACVPPRMVIGNRCVECPADVVLDGNTLNGGEALNAGFSVPGDTCPETFFLQINNPVRVFLRGATTFSVSLDPTTLNAPQCNRPFTMLVEQETRFGIVKDPPVVGVGIFSPPPKDGLFGACSGTPEHTFVLPDLVNTDTTTTRIGTPTDLRTTISVQANLPGPQPR